MRRACCPGEHSSWGRQIRLIKLGALRILPQLPCAKCQIIHKSEAKAAFNKSIEKENLVWQETSSSRAWKGSREVEIFLLVEYLPPLPTSSASTLFPAFGVFCSSSADSTPSASTAGSRAPGMVKFSSVLFRTSPPLAVRFSTISGGGGSSPNDI